MRAAVCRVEQAQVAVDGEVVGAIGRGLLVYVGVFGGDVAADADWLAEKLTALRVFGDDDGKMNRSVAEVAGGVLLIPNFTLAGRTRKGTRPSFTDAAAPPHAAPLFDRLATRCAERVAVATGVFGAHMIIDARFDGPVTVIVDSPDRGAA